MTPAILFIDRDDRFVSEVRRVLGDSFAGYDIRYATENVMRVPRGDALFVSPANSLGFMDGGIDAAYMDMFPGIEPRVKSAIAKLGYTTSLGQPYMSVGSAVVVPAQPEANAWLASCPTMFLPGNVHGTNNAYFAFWGRSTRRPPRTGCGRWCALASRRASGRCRWTSAPRRSDRPCSTEHGAQRGPRRSTPGSTRISQRRRTLSSRATTCTGRSRRSRAESGTPARDRAWGWAAGQGEVGVDSAAMLVPLRPVCATEPYGEAYGIIDAWMESVPTCPSGSDSDLLWVDGAYARAILCNLPPMSPKAWA